MILWSDVDLTVVDPIPAWIEWLEEKTGYSPRLPPSARNYDITKYWPDAALCGLDPFDFWRERDLYASLTPDPYAVLVLTKLYQEGWRIRFVSHIKGHHYHSKVAMLKRHFPFMEGIVATKEKWLLEGDVLVDDRAEHLLQSPCKRRFLIWSQYAQTTPTEGLEKVRSWSNIYEKLQEYRHTV